MSTMYRIYIAAHYNGARLSLAPLLHGCGIIGATFYRTEGMWKGAVEPAIVVEVVEVLGVTLEIQPLWPKILDFARRAAGLYGQECVLVTMQLLSEARLVASNGVAP